MNTPARKVPLVEKLRVLIEASRLDESRRVESLRREGVHAAQLKQWRAEVEAALHHGSKQGTRSAAVKRIKELEWELRLARAALDGERAPGQYPPLARWWPAGGP